MSRPHRETAISKECMAAVLSHSLHVPFWTAEDNSWRGLVSMGDPIIVEVSGVRLSNGWCYVCIAANYISPIAWGTGYLFRKEAMVELRALLENQP